MSKIIGNTVGTTMNPQLLSRNGKSAYEIAVEHGFKGTEIEWLTSLKGETPRKGVDYLTDEDIAEIVGQIGDQSGAGDFIITATADVGELTDISATFEEIRNAHAAGREICLHISYPYTSGVIILECTSINEDNAIFDTVSNVTGETVVHSANIFNDDTSVYVSSIIGGDDYTLTDEDKNDIADIITTGLTLGVHTDGLIYIFKDGVPIGNGLQLSAGGGGAGGDNDSGGESESTVPENTLLSADGYFLTDADGVYLIPAEY